MAEANISITQEDLICPICLELLKDPVTINCGHSFCKVCINHHWDEEDLKGVYSCPQCRDLSTPRPFLHRNNMLAEVVEKLKKKSRIQASSSSDYFVAGDVECDLCTGKKKKAVKSCLVCVASFCETHLEPHYVSPAFMVHALTENPAKLREKICSKHYRLMEIYCRTDQTCVCYLCTMDKHKGHDTITASEERAEKQSELKKQQKKSQLTIQEKQKKVRELKQAMNNIKLSAQTAVEDSEKIFTEMISSMEKNRSEVTEMIRDQEKAEVSRAERLLEELEQEIADLQRRDTELEQLSNTRDHIHFLQSFQSLCVSAGRHSPPIDRPNFHTSSIPVHQHQLTDGLKNYFSDLKTRLEEFCEEEFNKIPAQVNFFLSEPQSRDEFLKYFRSLTLDPDTVHRNLVLSEKNRGVRFSVSEQPYSDHPQRFDSCIQVLSKESVCGRCYWEVEWSSVGGVSISVSYKDISRKGEGDECGFGCNNQSWSLQCSPSSVGFRHMDITNDLRVPSSSRIGVYVDHGAGTLSFYSVSDTITLLHRVRTTFTQPLYAGFGISWMSGSTSVRLCDPE